MINKLEDLIPKFYKTEEEIDWKIVSIEHQLSDSFIERYQNKVNWQKISMRHKISPQFLERFESKIKWSSVIFNPNFNYDLIIKYIDKLQNADINNYIRFNMNNLSKLSELRLIKELLNN